MLVEPGDALANTPSRVLVAGTSGAGKTTLAAAIGASLNLPHIEIDGLFHGPNWTPRTQFRRKLMPSAGRTAGLPNGSTRRFGSSWPSGPT